MSSRHGGEIRVGTRASCLARWQAEWVASSLRGNHPGLEVSLVNIKTHGDQDQTSPLATVGGTGLFTKELQRALLDERVDLAVHSLKDLPTSCPEGLVLAAVPHREDVFDALIAPTYRTLQAMPSGAQVGTSSMRRRAQILYGYPQVHVIPIRGNIETRLNLALDGKLSGVLLAYAGLHRLNLEHNVTERLGPPSFLPAAGQGALGIECRADDTHTLALIQTLDNQEAHQAILAERATLAELEGGCLIPLGAWARQLPDPGPDMYVLALDAAIFDADGRNRLTVSLTGPCADPVSLGRQAARALCAQGARELLQETQYPRS